MTQIETIIEPDGILDSIGRKSIALVRTIWRAHLAIVRQLQLICQYPPRHIQTNIVNALSTVSMQYTSCFNPPRR